MTRVSYHPEPGVSDETEQFGIAFSGGEPADVSDPRALAKFRGNRFFTVHEDEEPAEEVTLKAIHKGRGVYAIVRGEEVIKEGLTKPDADAFNALSDEDKAEYVAE